MHLTISGSVNGGVCLTFSHECKVWVDFCPDGKTRLWEHVSDEDWETIRSDTALFPPDAVLYTHCHPDHFSLKRTEEILRDFPKTAVVVPKGEAWSESMGGFLSSASLCCEKISEDEVIKTVGKLTIRFLRSRHSGREYAGVNHYSLFLTYEGKSVFISGDAALSDRELIKKMETLSTDLAILNFPWASLTNGRESVASSIRPSHVYLVHLPSAEKDAFGYRKAAQNGAELLDVPDVRLMLNRFSTESFVL